MQKLRFFLGRHIEGLHVLGMGLAIVLVSSLELALTERRFGILSGGFGASQVLNRPIEFLALFSQWLPAQIATFIVLHTLVRWLLGKRWNGILALLVSITALLLIPTGVLLAKHQVLQYFGDAMGLELVRRLAGGSTFDAFLYLGAEIFPFLLAGLAGLAALVWLVRSLLRRDLPAAPGRYRPSRQRWLAVVALLGTSVLAMALCADIRDSKYIAHKFTVPALLRNTISAVTDGDRDGYGLLALQPDPQPLNAAIYPLAYDAPDNGIDEDGYCGDFSLPPQPHRAAALPPDSHLRFKHVILVVLESTRSDALSAQVNDRPVAPHLRRLAQMGSSTQAYSHAGFTVPSLISLFTGALEPRSTRTSLFADLKARQFHIGVISGQAEGFGGIDAATDMRQQADFFMDAETLKTQRVFSSTAQGSLRVDEKVLFQTFESRYGKPENWAQSNFLYFNFQAPHFPYHHPDMGRLVEPHPLARNAIVPANKDQLVRTYWNAVAWSDHWLGEIEKKLTQLGVREDVLLVVAADHGESLFDEGFLGHGHQISDIQTRIPLVLSAPHIALDGAWGLMDLRELILQVMAGTPVTARSAPVFQYVGGLERPAMIGLVDRHGARTTLNTTSRKITFSDTPAEQDFDQLRGAPAQQACQLIQAWEMHRFLSRNAPAH